MGSAEVRFDRIRMDREGLSLGAQRYWTGEARPADLVLAHGLMSRGTNWDRAAVHWARKGWSVLVPDARGHGLSGRAEPVPGAYSREALVGDLEAWAEGWARPGCALVGHSTGGLNAWVAAARNPDRYGAVVIVDFGASLGWTGTPGSWAQWFDTWPLPFPSLGAVRDYFAALRPSHGRHFVEFFREAEDGWRPGFDREAALLTVAGNNVRDWWADLAQVRCPALLVKGAESDLTLEEARKMEAVLPQGRLAVVDGAAHVVHEDCPEAFHAEVDPFLLGALGTPVREAV